VAVLIDTVEYALSTPEKEQTYASLGLQEQEYRQICAVLGRRPTSAELAMYSVMWSEHCSYKSSKIHLRKFGEKMTDNVRKYLMVGMGENAGVVDIGDGWAVTFKIESHNHPSFVEPFQGAATGVGGIVRDIMAMGARPVAVMDQLRFGNVDNEDTKRIVAGVVAGIGHYGNCLGLPNIGGELEFDKSYQGNPLVNALCLGVLRHEDLHLSGATGHGNHIVLFGARTGGDGIGGASILASDAFSGEGETKRPSVQVGDPFMEKILIECCLEMFSAGVIAGIQDLGAAGISCATSEMAAMGDGGMHVNLERVLLRDKSVTPEQILMSESQERMMAAVPPHKLAEFMSIADRWDVETAIIGQVNGSGRLTIDYHGQRIVDIDPRTAAIASPVYDRPHKRPLWQDYLNSHSVQIDALKKPTTLQEMKETALKMLQWPNLASKKWVTDQYDRYVRGNTVLAMPDDAGVVRIDESTGLGVAISTDSNSRFAKLDPREGARLALAEAYLNIAAVGARPLAVTDCLNFGNPEQTDTMWQLVEAIEGLADGCCELEIPVTGGNVSLYNSTGSAENGVNSSINPTPVIGVLGVLENVAKAVPSGFLNSEHVIFQLGNTFPELDGSVWADCIHGHLGGMPPIVDYDMVKRVGNVLVDGACLGFVKSAHDVSDGGLFQALFECAFRRQIGCKVKLDALKRRDNIDDTEALFSESVGRVLVMVDPSDEKFLTVLCVQYNVPYVILGTTGQHVDEPANTVFVEGLFEISIDQAKKMSEEVLPSKFE
jgi:phosphoribosylformylglycinamidine synthase